ncbi:MAG: TonB-dependent receptor [Xanthomonadales bacterium]|nr:TonB-dependent receptor [Xanthomonadales bacterium]
MVTARKIEESVQDVPVSVNVVTSNTIDQYAAQNLEDIAKFTPGLIFDSSGTRDADRPVIRGQANILGFSGVSYFIDGVYITGSINDYDLSDVERMEIIKGPQSALYGRNTYSGAINIVTQKPGDEVETRLKLRAGEHGEFEGSAAFKGPLIEDTLYGGINIRSFTFDGEHKNAFDGEELGEADSDSISANLLWTPNDRTEVRFRSYYTSSKDGQPPNFLQVADENNCFFDNGNLYGGGGRYFCGEIQPRQPNVDLDSQFVDGEPRNKFRTYQTSLNVAFNINDEWTLRSITGHNKRTTDFIIDGDYLPTQFQAVPFTPTAFPFTGFADGPPFGFGYVVGMTDFSFSNINRTEDVSQELRLEFDNGDNVRGLIGAYYFDGKSDTRDNRTLPADGQAQADANFGALFGAQFAACAANPICEFVVPFGSSTILVPRNVSKLDTTNTAIFGMVEYDINDQWSITAEGRWADEEIDRFGSSRNLGDPFPTPALASASFDSFNPRLTLDYSPTEENLLYLVYAEGNKPGGFNNQTATNAGIPTFEEEEVDSIEIGSKNLLADGQVVLNASAYFNEVTGYQLTQNVQSGQNAVSATVNAGDADINGLELELIYEPAGVEGLTLIANYAYTDAEFTRGTDVNEGVLNDAADDGLINCSIGDQFPDVEGCTSLYGSIVGKKVPRTAEHQLFFDVGYRQPFQNNNWEWYVGGNVSYESEKFAQVHSFAEWGEATVVDLRLGFENDQYSIQLWGKNVTDEDSPMQVIRYLDADNFRRAFNGALRPGTQWGLTFTADF